MPIKWVSRSFGSLWLSVRRDRHLTGKQCCVEAHKVAACHVTRKGKSVHEIQHGLVVLTEIRFEVAFKATRRGGAIFSSSSNLRACADCGNGLLRMGRGRVLFIHFEPFQIGKPFLRFQMS